MADIFDEIGEDLRAERTQALLKRYAGVMVAAVVAVIVGVGGWQAWRWQSQKQTSQVAASFLGAMRETAGLPAAGDAAASRQQAAATFADIAANGPPGYRTLARMREAALRAGAGDLQAALGLWDQVSADTSADPLLRGAADLMWVQHQVDGGEPAAVEGRLAPLLAPGSPWRALAMENEALLAIRTGDEGKARDVLKRLLADGAAPEGVRARATGLLSRLGETPGAVQGAGG